MKENENALSKIVRSRLYIDERLTDFVQLAERHAGLDRCSVEVDDDTIDIVPEGVKGLIFRVFYRGDLRQIPDMYALNFSLYAERFDNASFDVKYYDFEETYAVEITIDPINLEGFEESKDFLFAKSAFGPAEINCETEVTAIDALERVEKLLIAFNALVLKLRGEGTVKEGGI
jgi:hypothetical protein